jgi:hypothetical protein
MREKKELKFSRVSVFVAPFNCEIAPPLQNQCSMVFIGKILLGFQTSPSTFLSFSFPLFFVNFDFSYFFYIFESEQYQRQLIKENQ